MKRRELDRFGGWMGKKFKATGFFRVEKDERWWLVTPEGSAFLSFGINHLHPDLWKQDYNRQAMEEAVGARRSEQPPIRTSHQGLVPTDVLSVRLQHSRSSHGVADRQ